MSRDGMCVIVTGSASGLGAATAAILAKAGARIIVNYSSSKKEAEETADLCRKAGGDIIVVQGDVAIAAGADDGERPYHARFPHGGRDYGSGVSQAADEDGRAGGDGV